jgi:protein-lysine N-methyltransferase EEF2KMT
MESQLSATARQQLDRFVRQYLQLQVHLDYPDEEHLRSDAFQHSLHSQLFSEHGIGNATPVRYQLRVLKELTRKIELSIQDWDEEVCRLLRGGLSTWHMLLIFASLSDYFVFQGISDNLMNCLSSLLASSIPSESISSQQKSYVTYTLSSLPLQDQATPTITLLEARNLVAASGTTGLRTWEAALHLGNYLCANRECLVREKSILELGAGTGYVSVLCAKHLEAKYVIATDGSDDVVASLSTNFYLNGLQDSTIIEGKELRWGQALVGGEHPEWNRGRYIDLALGADLTYDGSGIPALVSTFGDLFDLYPQIKIMYAATVRNPKTFEWFLDACRANSYVIEQINFGIEKSELQDGPFYSDQVPIQLCFITKS